VSVQQPEESSLSSLLPPSSADGVDLHAHTTASDGDQSPTALVWWAKCVGLSAIAVTDHDTTDGIAEATEAGRKYGIEVVPGIELSAEIPSPAQCHILGYFIDPNHAPLQARLQWVRDARDSRNARMAEKIQAHGWDVTLEEVEAAAGGDVVARPHFAKVLLAKGYVGSIAEAFDRYLARGGLFYVDRVRLQPDEAIALIQGAGGVAILAHPNNLKRDEAETEAAIQGLKALGLDGIEARYNLHTAADMARYLALAERLGLLTSGGSDFHGPTVKEKVYLGHVEGDRPAPISVLDALKAARPAA
jgi:3',5'-nucleoside bisphosphate phosphatase